jgi:hypothetical protein
MNLKNKSQINKKLRMKNMSKKIRKSQRVNLKGGVNCRQLIDDLQCRARAPECLWNFPRRICVDNNDPAVLARYPPEAPVIPQAAVAAARPVNPQAAVAAAAPVNHQAARPVNHQAARPVIPQAAVPAVIPQAAVPAVIPQAAVPAVNPPVELNATVVDIVLIRNNNTFEVLNIFNKFSKQTVMEANRNIDACRAAIALFQTQLARIFDYTRENLVTQFNIRDAVANHVEMGVLSQTNCIICRIPLFTHGIKCIRSDNNELFCEQCFQNNIFLKPIEQIAFSEAVIARPNFIPVYHRLDGTDSPFSAPFEFKLALNQDLLTTFGFYRQPNNDIALIASIIAANASMAIRYTNGVTVPPNVETTSLAKNVYTLFYNATIEIAQILSQRP